MNFDNWKGVYEAISGGKPSAIERQAREGENHPDNALGRAFLYDIGSANGFDHLGRYETRFNRRLHQLIADLRKLQDDRARREARRSRLDEARAKKPASQRAFECAPDHAATSFLQNDLTEHSRTPLSIA